MNQDIVSDHSGNEIMQSKDELKDVQMVDDTYAAVPPGCQPTELNPKSYTYLPS